MSLFPAYSSYKQDIEHVAGGSPSGQSDGSAAEWLESQLLASDGDEERCGPTREQPRPEGDERADFYVDCKLDRGNLRVSTLYYPGRPEYACRAAPRVERRARARYYSRRAPDAPAAPALAARLDAFRHLLARDPRDLALWESFIDFQEVCGDADSALAAAEEGAARLPQSARLRERLLGAVCRALPPHAALARLRDMLAAEREPRRRVPLWEALLRALAAAPGGDAAQLDAAAAAALADTRAAPAAYPRLLLAHGRLLAAAGLAERLTLLVELVVAMNFAPDAAAPFPPPAAREERARAERRLREREAAALRSGLPLGAVWVRVERLRGAAHWAPGAPDAADPQRAPVAHDVAELLAAARAGAALAARLLLLARVPALPGAGCTARWAGGAARGAEALLPLLSAAAALPAARGAHAAPRAARAALLLLHDPPHYFADDAGYLRWVDALWDALAARLRGDARTALACWRVRWLGALALAAEPPDVARLRARAKALLRAQDHPLPFVEFARLECAAAGRQRAAAAAAAALRAALQRAAAAAAAALRAALQRAAAAAAAALRAALQRAAAAAAAALRAALQRADLPPPVRLHAARAVAELSAHGAQLSAAGACALVCAVLRRAPPPGLPAPAPADLAAALDECERQCATIEAALEAAADEDEDERDEDEVVAGALLPGAGEWAAARALLAPPGRRAQLLRRLRAAAAAAGGAAARYWEEGGAALAAAAAREGRAGGVARELLPLFPHNAQLALESASAPLWAWSGAAAAAGAAGVGGAAQRLRALAPRSDTAALAALLPLLARALDADFAPPEAERLVRAARRATAGGGGELVWALRLEAEARAPRPRLQRALYAALDAAPAAKWLYVRGAAWCGGDAPALADALLERALRLHALPDELRPLPGAPTPATGGAPGGATDGATGDAPGGATDGATGDATEDKQINE